MEQTFFPLLKEITIDSIAEHCRHEFGINKGTFEQTIFHAGGWLSRIRRGKSKMDDLHYQEMFNLLKTNSGGNSDSFITTMKAWYPSLTKYTNEAEITSIIKANLAGIALDAAHIPVNTVPHLHSKQFIETCLKYHSPIKCVKIAAQTGWRWFDDHERTNLLTRLAQEKIQIRFIGNYASPEMKRIAAAMKDPSKELRYSGINATLAKWHEYEKAYSSILFRVSDYPILRQTLIVEFEDNSARALLRDYAYGSPVERFSPHKQVFCNEPDFNYYHTEFEFLWDNAHTYEQWYATLPKPEETLQPGDYFLISPSHVKTVADSPKWIYSALSISSNNTAALKVNIADSLEAIESNNDWEYSYQGNLKLTRSNVFIFLYDNEQQESITISLVRPLHKKDRFIGIMTALSPSGQQPIAFKCVCIDRSILHNLNYQMIEKWLTHNNKEWDDNLLALESQDINLFYSDSVFSHKSHSF